MPSHSSLLVALAALCTCPLAAQLDVRFDQSVPVTSNGQVLDLAWAGGLNSAQLSEVDLNGDGLKDLFIFDRSGRGFVTLLNNGTPGTAAYSLTRTYDQVHPFPTLHDWVLFRDYNCDGKDDIFTYSNAGFAVYKNISNGGDLSFELVDPQVKADYVMESGSVVRSNLLILSVDMPGLADVDGDGDLDILTFGIWDASHVGYFKNLSMEQYGTCDSLIFRERNKCWGFFAENTNNNSITLNAPCPYNLPNPEMRPEDWVHMIPDDRAHAGSSVTPIDLDGDGVKDLLLGDISYNNIVALYNGGDVSAALMTAVDSLYPSTNVPVDLPLYPAGFHLDIDNDGDRDLVFSPNVGPQSLGRNQHSMFLYRNTGSDASPAFEKQDESLFQDRMLDFGEGAFPVAFDHDGDGLMDLVVANHGYYIEPNDGYVGRLALLRNTGTPTAPAFDLVTDDYMGISALGIGTSMYPAFADLDGDGDKDMYIGDALGRLHFFRNVSTGPVADLQLAQALIPDASGTTLDVGQFAAPQFFDVDGDGLLDLLIGERNGNLNYYRNTATAAAPEWTLVEDSIGGVVTAVGFEVTGSSVPQMYLNADGEREILLGSESGLLMRYGNIEGNILGEWTLLDQSFMGLNEGIRSAPCLVDLTGDGKLDMVLGNYRGGLSFWSSESDVGVPSITRNGAAHFAVFPNPAGEFAELILHTPLAPGQAWVLRNAIGQEVLRLPATAQRTTLDLSNVQEGLYLISLQNGLGTTTTQRLVVVR